MKWKKISVAYTFECSFHFIKKKIIQSRQRLNIHYYISLSVIYINHSTVNIPVIDGGIDLE